MNDVEIIKMQELDLKEVAEVFRTVFNEEGENWDERNSLKRIQENFHGNAHYVSKVNGRIVGMVMAIPATLELDSVLVVDSLVVLKEYRGQGIGKGLWEYIEKYAKEKGYKSVRLFANPKWDSYQMYTKLGYKPSGWIELFKEVK